MKFYCLHSEPNRPCSVLCFKDTTVLLDCCLDQTPVQHFLPLQLVPNQRTNNMAYWLPREADAPLEGELRECSNRVFVDSSPEFKVPLGQLIGFNELDVILISNYLSILALPFITNNSGFQGTVLMTEPTLQFGRLLMKELVEYIERCPKARVCSMWKQCVRLLPPPLCYVKQPNTWRQIYNTKQITEALSYVRIVAYNEPVKLCGSVTITATCSGLSVGSCNWLLSTYEHKIVYMSASSSLTMHPKPLDLLSIREPDVLILSSLSHRPLSNPDHMMNEFCVTAVHTIRNNGCVLVPCYPSGLVYDMIECLVAQFDSSGSTMVPIYFISAVADQSLTYSNIFSEWLSASKQSKVYQQEEPFLHAQLARSGRVRAFKSLHAEGFSQEFRQPCVVFCGHPSLRFGDAVHFMELWGNNPHNAVIFTEPEFDLADAVAPYQPLAMRQLCCPIDTCLNYTQATKLVSELRPTSVLLPAAYTKPPPLTAVRSDSKLDLQWPVPHLYKELSIVRVPLHRTVEPAVISPALAERLALVPVRGADAGASAPGGGLAATTLTVKFVEQDGSFRFEVLENLDADKLSKDEEQGEDEEMEEITSKSINSEHQLVEEDPEIPGDEFPKRYPYGSLCVEDLMQGLSQAGMVDAKLEEDTGGCIITIESEDAMLQIRDNSTHIITSRSEIREKIRDLLLRCLHHV